MPRKHYCVDCGEVHGVVCPLLARLTGVSAAQKAVDAFTAKAMAEYRALPDARATLYYRASGPGVAGDVIVLHTEADVPEGYFAALVISSAWSYDKVAMEIRASIRRLPVLAWE